MMMASEVGVYCFTLLAMILKSFSLDSYCISVTILDHADAFTTAAIDCANSVFSVTKMILVKCLSASSQMRFAAVIPLAYLNMYFHTSDMFGDCDAATILTILFSCAILLTASASDEQTPHSMIGTMSMVISFCAADVASAPLHFPSSTTSSIFTLLEDALNSFAAIVIALIVSSPYVLAGQERGAITPTFTVWGLVVSSCCQQPTRSSVDVIAVSKRIFFMY
jgi:hypothetical protein